MSNPVRIGLVGLGRAGWGMHMPELEDKTDKFIFVAACDLIEERRRAMEEKIPGWTKSGAISMPPSGRESPSPLHFPKRWA